jgi:hypothetical protein
MHSRGCIICKVGYVWEYTVQKWCSCKYSEEAASLVQHYFPFLKGESHEILWYGFWHSFERSEVCTNAKRVCSLFKILMSCWIFYIFASRRIVCLPCEWRWAIRLSAAYANVVFGDKFLKMASVLVRGSCSPGLGVISALHNFLCKTNRKYRTFEPQSKTKVQLHSQGKLTMLRCENQKIWHKNENWNSKQTAL